MCRQHIRFRRDLVRVGVAGGRGDRRPHALTIGRIEPHEIGAACEIFRRAFEAEHGGRYRNGGRPGALESVWAFVRECDPQTFLAARDDGRLVGYAIFVRSLRRIQRRAVLSGAVLRWGYEALKGGFALRLAVLPRILANKALFIRGGGRFRTRGDAQLLNVAVDPPAQGRGIARTLISEGLRAMCERGVTEVRLEVRPWNEPALRLYRRTGWRDAGRTRDLEGEWLVMVANCEGSERRAVAQFG